MGVDTTRVLETYVMAISPSMNLAWGQSWKLLSNQAILTISTEPEEADAFLIAVQPPSTQKCTADTMADNTNLQIARCDIRNRAIVPHLRKGNMVILNHSPPRTTIDLVAPILERSGSGPAPILPVLFPGARAPGQILSRTY